ncbi:hypothetical protein TWF506_009424 [Arthrobotrys conoides]|uniref:Uncharacterized protein n=1 Tax=Arthrobotrys conoides TaxID=74498 RepID=A0AAN8NDQ9_9PEZI
MALITNQNHIFEKEALIRCPNLTKLGITSSLANGHQGKIYNFKVEWRSKTLSETSFEAELTEVRNYPGFRDFPLYKASAPPDEVLQEIVALLGATSQMTAAILQLYNSYNDATRREFYWQRAYPNQPAV